MTQIFISYSRRDIEFVQRLANDLKAAGFEVWYDLSGLEAGTLWGSEIQKAIQASQYFLVALSPNSIKSDWVEREFLFASDQGLKIIPILYEPCKLPMWSLHLQFIDLQEKNYTRNYPELLKVMGVSTEGHAENPIAVRYIEIGDEYRKMGQPEQAIESYQQALKVDPGNLKALCNVGAVYLASQSYAEAAASYERALQFSEGDLVARSGWSDANMAMGNQASADGDLAEATHCYLEILKVVPDEINARVNLANITRSRVDSLLESGQEEKAEKLLIEILDAVPGEKTLTSRLEKLQAERISRLIREKTAQSEEALAEGDWEKAIAILNEALQAAPDDEAILKRIEQIRKQKNQQKLDAILKKVDLAEQEERWDTALAGLNEYLQLKPEDAAIKKRLADLMASKRAAWLSGISLRVDNAVANRSWDEARDVLNEALGVEPENKELKARAAQVEKDQLKAKLDAILLRADQAAGARRWDDAVEILNAGIKDYPDDKNLKARLKDTLQARRREMQETTLRMADLNARAGKWEEALNAINEVLAEEPDNKPFIEKYDQILQMESNSKLKALKKKAQDLMKANKLDEALKVWNETLSIETVNRQAVMDEIEGIIKAQKLEREYNEAQQAFNNKEYQKALDLLKEIETEAGDYKDTGKLLQKVEKWRRSTQKGDAGKKKKPWAAIGIAAILVLGIGGSVYWFGKNGLPGAQTQAESPTSTSWIDNVYNSYLTGTPVNSSPYQKFTNPDNGHEYSYIKESSNWHEARDYCAGEGGYLVTIQDAAENQFVFDLSGGGNTWLGATDEVKNGTWEWVSGEPWLYPNWGPGGLGVDHYLSFLLPEFPTTWKTIPDEKWQFTCEWDNQAQALEGETIVVTSVDDSGTGTLRQAILDAQSGDTITFDTAVFPPDDPATIFIDKYLPDISQGSITIDASNAGVILDGSLINSSCLTINSDRNTIMGLQIINFKAAGIVLVGGGSFNHIGGDRNVGSGPIGQGNQISYNDEGIRISSTGDGNVIMGNLIGTNLEGTGLNGNSGAGIYFEGGGIGAVSSHPSPNIVGPDNVIAHNGGDGIHNESVKVPNFITANSIHDNGGAGISYSDNPDGDPATILDPPSILYFDLGGGTISGQTCSGCVVEIYSTENQNGSIFEGMVLADEYGNFTFNKGSAFSGPYLTATTRSENSSTSRFSQATAASSEIQNALDWIQNNQPIYQTSFDNLNGWSGEGSPDNGKLIVTSQGSNIGVNQTISATDSLAVEFELRILDANPANDRCYFSAWENINSDVDRSLGAGFWIDNRATLEHFMPPSDWPFLVETESIYDFQSSNKVNLFIIKDKIVAFINDNLAYSLINPDENMIYTSLGFASEQYISCEFDNYKMWDLSGVNLSP